MDSAKTFVHALVSCRLDYNSLLAGITGGLLNKLQAVQNATARVVSRTRKFDHTTPVLHDLLSMGESPVFHVGSELDPFDSPLMGSY